jgi:hypothetical protein
MRHGQVNLSSPRSGICDVIPLLLVRLADREWIWNGMMGDWHDWQDEWDLKRRGSYRGVNTHDTCRAAAQLDHRLQWIAEKAGSH